MIRRTSLSTYKAIQATGVLSFKRMMVYDYLYRNGPLTGGQVQKELGSGVSESIRNRITELVKMGVVYEVRETKCPITGRNVMLFDVTENMPKEYVAPKTKNQIIKELKEKIVELESMMPRAYFLIDRYSYNTPLDGIRKMCSEWCEKYKETV